MGGIEFRDFADNNARQQAAHYAQGEFPPVGEAQHVEHAEREHGNEHGRQVGAHGQRLEEVHQAGAFLGAHHVNTDDREHYADGGDHHRSQDGPHLHIRTLRKEGRCAQRHGGQDGAAVALVQVCAHTGYIAHVVAHIIGNGGGVTGVVLRDVLLHFTHNVGPYIGRFGIDAAAHAGKERLRGGAHPEGEHGGGDDDQVLRIRRVIENLEHTPPDGNVQQAQAHHGEAHDGAAAEGNFKAGIEAAHGGIGRAGTGIRGGFHAHEAGQAAEKAAREEGKRHPGVLYAKAIGQHGKKRRQDNENNDDNFVLLFEVRHGALSHVLRDFFHGGRAFAFLHHLTEENPGEQQRNHCCHRHQIKQCGHSYRLLIGLCYLPAGTLITSPCSCATVFFHSSV